MNLQAIRYETNRASRIHALLKVRDDAEEEVAALLREELDAVGEVAWLAWCEREFGWKRTAAYTHLNPNGVHEDRERKTVKSGIPDIPPKYKILKPPSKLSTALWDFVEEIKHHSVESIIERQVKDFKRTGWGHDETLVNSLKRAHIWLGHLIEGLEPLIVTCETKKRKE